MTTREDTAPKTPADGAIAEKARPATPPPPAAAPVAGYVGAVLALLTLAVGVVAIRDGAVSAGWLDGRPWTLNAVEWLDGLTFQWWMFPVGILAILAGVWSVYTALRPRRHTGLQLAADSSVWIGKTDLARIATSAAERVPGVLGARSSATLRKVTVTGVTTAADRGRSGNQLKGAVTAAVEKTLETVMASPPKVAVRVRTGGR
jgi:hypothetical protein